MVSGDCRRLTSLMGRRLSKKLSLFQQAAVATVRIARALDLALVGLSVERRPLSAQRWHGVDASVLTGTVARVAFLANFRTLSIRLARGLRLGAAASAVAPHQREDRAGE